MSRCCDHVATLLREMIVQVHLNKGVLICLDYEQKLNTNSKYYHKKLATPSLKNVCEIAEFEKHCLK